MMIIKFFANLREITKDHEITLKLENVKVKDALLVLEEKYGRDFRDVVFDPEGELYVRILINGRNIEYLEGLDTQVAGDDTVSLFPPVAGGSHAEL